MREFASDRLADRRIRLNHSTTSLAAELGVSAATIRSIEGGVSAARYEFGFLTSYAAALGLTFDQLFDDGIMPAPADDVAAVTGTLIAAGGTVHLDPLCRALGWEPERVRAALDAAGEQLAPLGLRLAFDADVSVTVHADVAVVPAVVDLSRQDIAHDGLTREQARLLVTVATAGTANRSDRLVTATALVDAGLLEYVKRPARTTKHGTRAALRLTKSARFDLVLD